MVWRYSNLHRLYNLADPQRPQTIYILLLSSYSLLSLFPSCSCYIVTFYFTHQLLPRLKGTTPKVLSADTWMNECDSVPSFPEEEQIIEFVKTFGAYLKLHTCLVCASDTGSGLVVRTLLDMARFDLRHREFLKALSNKQAFLLYEPVSFKPFE